MAAHQTPLSLGFSRQEHWSGLPFPSPMHESEKWKWSRSVVSDSWPAHGLQPTRLLPSMGFSRQEYWSVLPLPSPCESITIFKFRDSLVVQWLRIHLVMQGTPVQSLVWEDPTCHMATEPQLVSPSSGACKLQLLSPRSMTTEAYALSSLCPETREAPAMEKLLNHN